MKSEYLDVVSLIERLHRHILESSSLSWTVSAFTISTTSKP